MYRYSELVLVRYYEYMYEYVCKLEYEYRYRYSCTACIQLYSTICGRVLLDIYIVDLQL
eukprot:COSAG01_NODE_2107_length_8406_cov_21.249158_10_plen_59_part_00